MSSRVASTLHEQSISIAMQTCERGIHSATMDSGSVDQGLESRSRTKGGVQARIGISNRDDGCQVESMGHLHRGVVHVRHDLHGAARLGIVLDVR